MLEVCERLRSFRAPALVVWTPEDRVQRPEHGRRLAELLPDARLVEIRDSYTLIMRDQPLAFARAVRDFVREGRAGGAGAASASSSDMPRSMPEESTPTSGAPS